MCPKAKREREGKAERDFCLCHNNHLIHWDDLSLLGRHAKSCNQVSIGCGNSFKLRMIKTGILLNWRRLSSLIL